jgi:hypothetical protein
MSSKAKVIVIPDEVERLEEQRRRRLDAQALALKGVRFQQQVFAALQFSLTGRIEQDPEEFELPLQEHVHSHVRHYKMQE